MAGLSCRWVPGRSEEPSATGLRRNARVQRLPTLSSHRCHAVIQASPNLQSKPVTLILHVAYAMSLAPFFVGSAKSRATSIGHAGSMHRHRPPPLTQNTLGGLRARRVDVILVWRVRTFSTAPCILLIVSSNLFLPQLYVHIRVSDALHGPSLRHPRPRRTARHNERTHRAKSVRTCMYVPPPPRPPRTPSQGNLAPTRKEQTLRSCCSDRC